MYPEVALHMFRKGTPWQRLYMLASADATNASGGVSLLGERLEFGEEVIALRRYDNDRGFQVGDTEGYDVLRWNGSCVTLHDGEFSYDPPSETGHSRVEWRWLGDKMQAALKTDRRIANNYKARRHHCKGVNWGDVTDKCVTYDRELIDSIVAYVRRSPTLPEPEAYPAATKAAASETETPHHKRKPPASPKKAEVSPEAWPVETPSVRPSTAGF